MKIKMSEVALKLIETDKSRPEYIDMITIQL